MGIEQSAAYCKTCQKQVLIQRTSANHILHLVLSLITFGVWLVIWFLVATDKKPWRCVHCGSDLGGGSHGWGMGGAFFSKKPSLHPKISKDTKKCPKCAELIKLEAKVCKHCGNTFNNDVIKQKQIELINIRALKCKLCGVTFLSADTEIINGKILCPSCFKAKPN